MYIYIYHSFSLGTVPPNKPQPRNEKLNTIPPFSKFETESCPH